MLIGSLTFAEDSVQKSPTRRWAPENASVTRRLYLPDEDADPDLLDEAALTLLGGATVEHETTGDAQERAWIQRRLPHYYPPTITYENPDPKPFLYAAQIPNCEPTSAPQGADVVGRSMYPWHRFTVVYEAAAHNLLEDAEVAARGEYDGGELYSPLAGSVEGGMEARPDEGDALESGWINSRFIVKQVDPASMAITLPAGYVKWQNLPERPASAVPPKVTLPEAYPFGFPYTQVRARIAYTWMAVPVAGVPTKAITRIQGRVNEFDFDGYQSGTLRFLDYKYRLYRSATGQRVADVQYNMLYIPNLDPVTGTFYGFNGAIRVVDGKPRCWPISGDGLAPTGPDYFNRVIATDDFSKLFRPDFPYTPPAVMLARSRARDGSGRSRRGVPLP